MIVTSSSKPNSVFNSKITSLFPNKIGTPIPSSQTLCAAFNTSKWSASAKIIVLGSLFALSCNNLTSLFADPILSINSSSYFSQSEIGSRATPLLIAALAIASGIL